MSSINSDVWLGVLEKAYPEVPNAERTWICEIRSKKSGSNWEVLTKAEYKAHAKGNRWNFKRCRKIHLNEMVNITRLAFNNAATNSMEDQEKERSPRKFVQIQLKHFIESPKIGTINEVDERFLEQLEDIKSSAETLDKIYKLLHGHVEEAVNKRKKAAKKNPLARINYMAWSKFCNPIKNVKRMESEIPNMTRDIYPLAHSTIRQRVLREADIIQKNGINGFENSRVKIREWLATKPEDTLTGPQKIAHKRIEALCKIGDVLRNEMKEARVRDGQQ